MLSKTGRLVPRLRIRVTIELWLALKQRQDAAGVGKRSYAHQSVVPGSKINSPPYVDPVESAVWRRQLPENLPAIKPVVCFVSFVVQIESQCQAL